jgi:hypothetical protein
MKAATVLAFVLPSLVMMSCVTDNGSSAGAGHAGAKPSAQAMDSVAIGHLMEAHLDYMAQMRNPGGSAPLSPVNCN